MHGHAIKGGLLALSICGYAVSSGPALAESYGGFGDTIIRPEALVAADSGTDRARPTPPSIFLAQNTDGGSSGALFDDPSEAARQTSNPLGGDFMVLINEFNLDFYTSDLPGADSEKTSFTHIFQPVIPFSMAETIGPDWILVNRPTLPIIYYADVPSGFNPTFPPGFDGSAVDFDSKSGFGDITHFSLLGTSTSGENDFLGKGDTVLAAGFSMNLPTGSSTFTTNSWALGPAAVAAYIGETGILGALVQTQFDLGNEDYNVMFVQPFYYVNLDDGWQVGGAPLWKFDFDTDEAQIPIGLGVQKTQLFDLGEGAVLPVRFGLEGRYHVEKNDAFGQEWSVVFSISPILPNIFGNWLKGCPAMSVGGC